MTITIRLKTDNAAFTDPDAGERDRDAQEYARDEEIRRILQTRLVNEWPFDRTTLIDSNGNTVGTVTVRGK